MRLSKIEYFISKIKQKLTHNSECVNDFYRKKGVKVGKNSIICDYINVNEPELLEIKNDCIISSEVAFITHDHSINKVTNKGSNLFGKITIGNNCFIGSRSTILYGVELADNIIVGSASVVTHSFCENNIIIAGNPAKKIGTWASFKEKYENKAAFREELSDIVSQKNTKNIYKVDSISKRKKEG